MKRFLTAAVLIGFFALNLVAAYVAGNVDSAQSSDQNVTTINDLNTSGATLLVAAVAGYEGVADVVFADSQTNTWSQCGSTQGGLGDMELRLLYVFAPSTSATHDFTGTSTGSFPAIAVRAYTGAVTSPCDQSSGAIAASATLATGSITPTEDNELVVSVSAFGSLTDLTENCAAVIATQKAATGNAYGIVLADVIQTTATAINCTWDSGGGATGKAVIIGSFKASTAGIVPLVHHYTQMRRH